MTSSISTLKPDPLLDLPARVPPAACPVEDWLQFLGHR